MQLPSLLSFLYLIPSLAPFPLDFILPTSLKIQIELKVACIYGDLKAVDLLIEKGASPGSSLFFGSPLEDAVKFGRVDVVSTLIRKYDATPRGRDLVAAVGWGKPEIVKLILEAGENLDINEAMSRVYRDERIEIGRLLLQSGGDVNCISERGVTALATASYLGELEVARFLIYSGADVNLLSPLSEAIITGKDEVALTLIAHGAKNEGRRDGETPLLLVIGSPDFQSRLSNPQGIIKALLGQNVSSAQLREGLLAALSRKNEEAALLLMDHGADVFFRNGSQTPILLAVENLRGTDPQDRNIKLHVLEAILKNPLSITDLRESLLVAEASGLSQARNLISQRMRGISSSLPDSVGHAVAPVILRKALASGAPWSDKFRNICKVASPEVLGKALRFAAEHGFLNLVVALRDRCGAPVSTPGSDGLTPLAVAAANGHGAVAELLAGHHVSVGEARSAFRAASENGHGALSERLQQKIIKSMYERLNVLGERLGYHVLSVIRSADSVGVTLLLINMIDLRPMFNGVVRLFG